MATPADVLFRFGASNAQRRRLAIRLKRWIELAQVLCAKQLVVDGSFVTDVEYPNDVDSVVFLPDNFQELIDSGDTAALELETMLLTRRPEEIFAAEDEVDWMEWIEFFTRTRESDGRRKGIIEIRL